MIEVTSIHISAGISLYMRPANGRRRYNATTSLLGWAHTSTDPCSVDTINSIDTFLHVEYIKRMRSITNFIQYTCAAIKQELINHSTEKKNHPLSKINKPGTKKTSTH